MANDLIQAIITLDKKTNKIYVTGQDDGNLIPLTETEVYGMDSWAHRANWDQIFQQINQFFNKVYFSKVADTSVKVPKKQSIKISNEPEKKNRIGDYT